MKQFSFSIIIVGLNVLRTKSRDSPRYSLHRTGRGTIKFRSAVLPNDQVFLEDYFWRAITV